MKNSELFNPIYEVFEPWDQPGVWVVSGTYTGRVYGSYATKAEAEAAADTLPVPRPGPLGWLA